MYFRKCRLLSNTTPIFLADTDGFVSWPRLNKLVFTCKMRMPGTVKCRPTVAYWVQIDDINVATELITRYYLTRHKSNAVLMLSQRLRRWPDIEPTSNKCTMFERKASCSPANTRHLYNIYTTSAQRFRRWSNIAWSHTNVLCLLSVNTSFWGQAFSKSPQ